jgi:hypothetical protein
MNQEAGVNILRIIVNALPEQDGRICQGGAAGSINHPSSI